MSTAFLGSSIIRKWNTSSCIPNSINLGISGLTSNDLMKTYVSKTKQLAHSENIVLYIGSNDVRKKHDPNTTVKNISTFLELLCQICPKANVLYVSIIHP
jgi:lysophospholipase L1-like esterase